MQSEPLISEFIMEIRRFDDIEQEIEQIPDSQVVGSLELDFSQYSCFVSLSLCVLPQASTALPA